MPTFFFFFFIQQSQINRKKNTACFTETFLWLCRSTKIFKSPNLFISTHTKYGDLVVWSWRGLFHWVVQPDTLFPDSALAFNALKSVCYCHS